MGCNMCTLSHVGRFPESPWIYMLQNPSTVLQSAVSASMQALRAPRVAPCFCPVRKQARPRPRKMSGLTRASLQDLIRERGLFTPTSIAQDFTVLTGATLLTAAIYVAVTKKKPKGTIYPIPTDLSLSWCIATCMHKLPGSCLIRVAI